MKISQKRQLDRFKRSLEFLDKHAKEFAPGSRMLSARDELKDVVGRAEANNTEPTEGKIGRRVYRSEKLVALNALRAELGRISRTADIIAKNDSSFNNKFEMPDKRRKDDLAEAARRFIQEMPKVSGKFHPFEMGEANVQKLQSALADYERVQTEPANKPARSQRTASSSDPVIDEGIELLNTVDAIMHNKYEQGDKEMAKWKEVSTLEVTRRKRKSGKNADASGS